MISVGSEWAGCWRQSGSQFVLSVRKALPSCAPWWDIGKYISGKYFRRIFGFLVNFEISKILKLKVIILNYDLIVIFYIFKELYFNFSYLVF